ncbi:Acetyltransferase (GNAT) family protein [Thermomonospora echinospora]|uniref:Acetyltransferase (GNAT) family protein n=1 Tax=Thermomonospora echinospora TaxID=1992 RepID=A0A1H5T3T6_9ACTN|nr:GNAT family N-acetyltransferase [Thermomonospora echinospora]SEF57425.1 Acetyltransferase (GNAT) family protein [Thermomonospora echinospora]
MSSVQIRPFVRADRDQLAALVNMHVAAVVPGMSASVQTVLDHLEREPGEFIVDPWVTERVTLVAVRRSRIVAAAHLLRYGAEGKVDETYRGAGEIRWLLCWPDSPDAGDCLALACLAQLARWRVRRRYADGTLPVPGVYGVPRQWPHVRDIYARAGFTVTGRTETVFLAVVGDLPRPGAAPAGPLTARRSLGVNGTRISAVRDGETVGHIEVDTNLGDAARLSRWGGWADVGDLWVAERHRRRGVGTWLMGQAAAWLRLAGVTRLLDYAEAGQDEYAAFLHRAGFIELTRTERGLTAP